MKVSQFDIIWGGGRSLLRSTDSVEHLLNEHHPAPYSFMKTSGQSGISSHNQVLL